MLYTQCVLTEHDKQWIKGELQQFSGELQQVRGDIQQIKGEFQQVKGDIQQIKGELQQVRGEIERVETSLLTEFHKWASPVEMRQRSHAAAIKALDVEMESMSDRLKNLEGR